MNFQKIKTFPLCPYRIDVDWTDVQATVERYIERYGADLSPDFQRGHVWTEEQQTKYCEYILRGGTSGKEIYFNHPSWRQSYGKGEMVLVDGKQRLNAVMKFMRNELRVFGHTLSEFEGYVPSHAGLAFNIASLKTREEVLRWYIDFNAGGTPHSPDEIDRVKALIDGC